MTYRLLVEDTIAGTHHTKMTRRIKVGKSTRLLRCVTFLYGDVFGHLLCQECVVEHSRVLTD